ncbi:hypothetical protein [Streptosporangium sp. NPDC049078]|uniref:hypothetical protein n=1 Tax=Streptosporangium sp. NPDC049078 TaxID=3155767 RepID=UPI00342CC3D8
MIALIVAAHDVVVRAAAWRASRDLNRLNDVVQMWAVVPANWCTHPGCPRCYSGGAR